MSIVVYLTTCAFCFRITKNVVFYIVKTKHITSRPVPQSISFKPACWCTNISVDQGMTCEKNSIVSARTVRVKAESPAVSTGQREDAGRTERRQVGRTGPALCKDLRKVPLTRSLSLLSFPSPLAPHCPTILTRGCQFHHLGLFSRPFYKLSSLFPRHLCNVYSSATLDKNSLVA